MSKPASIPKGYNSITPYFTVEDADGFIAFLATAFDAIVISESRYSDSRVQHARLIVGDSIIMLNEATDTYPNNVSQMHLFVEDCDKTYYSALQAGAISTMEPNDRPHGDRMAGIKDPSNNIWWIATYRQTS